MSPNGSSDGGGTLLITGGAGFVGAVLVERLGPDQPRVVVDDLSVGRPMPAPVPGLVCHQADIRDRAAMAELLRRHRPRAVIHLAAIHHIPTCERDPHHALDVNIMGFQSVLDACAASGCRRVVLASSGAVYAWADGALSETAALAPRDVYAASKAANEHQLTAWAMAGHGTGVIARMFNVIGPNDPNGHLIPDLLRRLSAAHDGRVRLAMGNIDRRRDFVDVRDMADGLARLVEMTVAPEVAVEAFNLCSGREATAAGIAQRLAVQLGVAAEIVVDPALCRTVDRPSQLGDPTKSQRVLDWRAGRDLDDSIAGIVRAWRGG